MNSTIIVKDRYLFRMKVCAWILISLFLSASSSLGGLTNEFLSSKVDLVLRMVESVPNPTPEQVAFINKERDQIEQIENREVRTKRVLEFAKYEPLSRQKISEWRDKLIYAQSALSNDLDDYSLETIAVYIAMQFADFGVSDALRRLSKEEVNLIKSNYAHTILNQILTWRLFGKKESD